MDEIARIRKIRYYDLRQWAAAYWEPYFNRRRMKNEFILINY